MERSKCVGFELEQQELDLVRDDIFESKTLMKYSINR